MLTLSFSSTRNTCDIFLTVSIDLKHINSSAGFRNLGMAIIFSRSHSEPGGGGRGWGRGGWAVVSAGEGEPSKYRIILFENLCK